MLPVHVEVGRNIRNAVVPMHKLVLIASDFAFDEKFKISVSDEGLSLESFKTISKSIKHLNNVLAIIVSNDQSSDNKFSEFLKITADIPKLIIAQECPPQGMHKWIKSKLVYPLINPSHKELIFYLKKAISDSQIRNKFEEMTEELSNAKKELSLFEEMSRCLTASLEMHDIIDNFMQLIVQNTSAQSWSLFLYDEEMDNLYLERTHKKRKKKEKKVILMLGEGIAGWVAQEGHPIIIPDVSRDSRISSKTKKEGIADNTSIICVPLKSKGELIGVLEVFNKRKKTPFTKHDLDIISNTAEHASVAIERASLYQKMADLAITDDLTKLFNSRYLNRTIELELARSERYSTSVSLIFMDLDYFKEVNDQHGHLVGSKVLVELGQLLIKGLRSVDIVSRYGGDEFVIVLPQTTPHVASEIAHRLRSSINKHVFVRKEGLNLRLTASFGIASYPESAGSKEELLRLADEAMYEVKNRERNGVYTIKA